MWRAIPNDVDIVYFLAAPCRPPRKVNPSGKHYVRTRNRDRTRNSMVFGEIGLKIGTSFKLKSLGISIGERPEGTPALVRTKAEAGLGGSRSRTDGLSNYLPAQQKNSPWIRASPFSISPHAMRQQLGKKVIYVATMLAFRHLQHRTWQRDCKVQDRRLKCAFAPLECMLIRTDSKMILCRKNPFDGLRTFFKKLFT